MKIRSVLNVDLDSLIMIDENIFNSGAYSKIDFVEFIKRKDIYKIFVFLEDKQICGYCILKYVLDEVELLKIAVKKEFRNRGIATKLFHFSLSKLVNPKKIYLEVDCENSEAINLYKKLGFDVFNVRKNYYSNNHDAYEMIMMIGN